MLTRLGVCAAILIANIAPAQATQGDALPAELQRAMEGFSQCLFTGVENAPSSSTPEAAAAAIVAGCARQRAEVETRLNAWMASLPAANLTRRMTPQQVREQFDGVEAQIAAGIRADRTGEADD